MKDYQKLAISVAIPLLCGFLGSFFTSSSVSTWYETLAKPAFNPPNWLFAPVWTLLFILIGISFYLVWKEDFGNRRTMAIGVYAVQLLLNLGWSFLFFGLKNPFLAFIEIIALWSAILINIAVFYKISKKAGLLLVPYLLWVSFASLLNYYVFLLN
ncbi:MAG: TspO/MBR family protein [Candidatus Bilamarchaeaceae archaeon]